MKELDGDIKEMRFGLKKEMERIAELEANAKNELIKRIGALPENPRINTISDKPKCYTMSISDMTGDKLSPQYHSFKCQHELVIDWLNKSSLNVVGNRVDSIIRTGYVKVDGQIHYFHPDVVEQLKGL